MPSVFRFRADSMFRHEASRSSLDRGQGYMSERTMVYVKRPRCDTNEGCGIEVPETTEQRNRRGKRRLHPVGAQRKARKTQNRKMVLRHGGAPLVTERKGGRRPAGTQDQETWSGFRKIPRGDSKRGVVQFFCFAVYCDFPWRQSHPKVVNSRRGLNAPLRARTGCRPKAQRRRARVTCAK